MANPSLTAIDVNADTFSAGFVKVNNAIESLRTEVVTCNASANGALTSGNGYVNGIFAALTIAATTIRGGNVQSASHINVASNTNFSGAQVNSSSNTNFSGANNYFSGPVTIVANTNYKSNTTFDILVITSNSTSSTLTANLGTITLNANVSITKNVSITDTLTVNNATTTNNLVANNISANTLTGGSVVSGNVALASEQTTTTGTSAQLISTYGIAYNTAKLVISVKDNSANAFQATELLILQDNGSTYLTEYAVLFSNTTLSTFSANSNSTFVRVYATPTIANATFKTSKILI